MGIEPVWVRIYSDFILWLWYGLFLYIILWILLPEATTAEKLEMESEPVNIDNIEKELDKNNNIEQKVKEELCK